MQLTTVHDPTAEAIEPEAPSIDGGQREANTAGPDPGEDGENPEAGNAAMQGTTDRTALLAEAAELLSETGNALQAAMRLAATRDLPMEAAEELIREAERASKPRVVLTPASELKAERIVWAWEGWLPTRTLTRMDGEEEHGKTTGWVAIGAPFTR